MNKASKSFKLTSVTLILLVLLIAVVFILIRYAFLRTDTSRLTMTDLKFIHPGITIAELRAELGPPQLRATRMYQYQIADNRKVIFRVDDSYRVQGAWILNQGGSRVDFFTGVPLPLLTLRQFDFLKRYISYEEVIKRLGEPDYEGGSGILKAEYSLADGQTVSLLLGSQQKDNILVEVVLGAWVSSEDNKLIDLFQ